MTGFHSTVSRRNFMKIISASAVGVGAAAAVAPVFHDVDELLSAPAGVQKRPWFVKERELENPTLEIDWTILKRADCRLNGQSEHWQSYYYGEDRTRGTFEKGLAYCLAQKDKPGYSYKNRALKMSKASNFPAYVSKTWAGIATSGSWKGAAYTGVQTPDERGEPKWTGTAEEGARMLSAYMRYRGSGICGFGELAGRTKNQVISNNHKGEIAGYVSPATGMADNVPTPSAACPEIVFEDVDLGYVGNNGAKYVIPNKAMYYISNLGPGSIDRAKVGPASQQQGEAEDTAQPTLRVSLYNFLRYLGYQLLGAGGDDGTPFIEGAAAVLSGVGESSRQGMYTLTPEYGAIGRLHNFLTDLPITPSAPIDSGMWRFCRSCHKCANICPNGVISQDKEPSYEMPLIEGKPYYVGHPGLKQFWTNNSGCMLYWRELGFLSAPQLYANGRTGVPAELSTGCFQCFAGCTFTQNNEAMVHEVIKGMIPNVSVFNGFLYKMAETFGYGPDLTNQEAEDWWDKSLPIFGVDTTRVAFDGGYRK